MKRFRARQWEVLAAARGLGFAFVLLAIVTSAWAWQGAAPVGSQTETESKQASGDLASRDVPSSAKAEYTVSPEDLLEVIVMDVPEISRSYRVNSGGFLTLPLLPEPIPAAGETLDQLSRLIANKFHDAGMLSNAQVSVSLKETRLHTVIVSGDVRRPQAYPVYGPTRLLQVLTEAGGLSDTAGDDAIITRGETGMRAVLAASTQPGDENLAPKGQSFTLNIRKLVMTGDDTTNILLYPGDCVMVQRAELVYILGAVNRPGGYVLNASRRQMTVLKALAIAGDVTGVAKRDRISILRRDPTGPEEKREEIPVNYKAMAKGKIADMKMLPDDILYVPESARLKATRTTLNTAVSMASLTATDMIIYH